MRKGGLFFWCSILFIGLLISVGVFQLLNTPNDNQKPNENIEDSEIVEVPDDADDKVDSADNILSQISPATLEKAKQNGIDLEKLRARSFNISESDISKIFKELDPNIDVSQLLEELGYESLDEYVKTLLPTQLESVQRLESVLQEMEADNITADYILSKMSPATLESAKQNGIDLEKLRARSIGNISESDISKTFKELGLDIDVSQMLKEMGYESLDEYMAFIEKTRLPTDINSIPIELDNRTAAEREASIKKLKSDLDKALLWMQENPQSRPVTSKYDIAHRREFQKNFKEQLSSYFIFDETGRIVGETDLYKQLREMENQSSDESPLTPALEEPATPFGESIPSSQQKWSPDTFRTTTRSNLSQWGGNINRQYFDVIFSPYLTQDEFDTLYPTPADRQRLQQRQATLQSELTKHFRKLLSPNTENRSQKVKIIQELLSDDYGNDIADAVIKQLNE
ncbi:MAG: hypothetical protein OXM61_23920 [Candidatus Poribacteria bacterium]|nr:hypothetical protein [Candidatus Poribacteria bacterium]